MNLVSFYFFFFLNFNLTNFYLFVGHTPNAAAIEATKNLISYGVAIGKIQSNYTLLGHRQTTRTSCPGDSLYELIKTWPHWSSI